MRRRIGATLLALALAAPAPALAASPSTASTPATATPPATTGSVTTVPAATTPSTTVTTVKGPGGTVTTVLVTKPKHSSSGISTGALIAAVIAGLLALACLVWAVFRFTALEPHWLLSWRHSLAEAGFRTSATWAEFKDWARLGG
jgi:hypothetical protein